MIFSLIHLLIERIAETIDAAIYSRSRWSWERGPRDRGIAVSGRLLVTGGFLTGTAYTLNTSGELWIEMFSLCDLNAGAGIDGFAYIESNGERLATVQTDSNVGNVPFPVRVVCQPGVVKINIFGGAAGSQFTWHLIAFERFPEAVDRDRDQEAPA